MWVCVCVCVCVYGRMVRCEHSFSIYRRGSYMVHILWASSICSFNFQTISDGSSSNRSRKKSIKCVFFSLSSFDFNRTRVFKSTKKKNCGVRKVKIIGKSAKVFLPKHIRKLNCSQYTLCWMKMTVTFHKRCKPMRMVRIAKSKKFDGNDFIRRIRIAHELYESAQVCPMISNFVCATHTKTACVVWLPYEAFEQ